MTGGAGFIGSHLVDRLLKMGHQVACYDNLATGQIANLNHHLTHPHFKMVIDSILNRIELGDQIQNCDVVIHLAADVGLSHVLENPVETMMTNVRGAVNVLVACYKHQKKLIFASSSEVYGKNINGPLSEEDDLIMGPPSLFRWSYGSAKLVIEQFALAYFQKGLPVSILRIFNTYGPRLNEDSVISIFIRQALEGKTLTISGDGKQKRCFTYVSDVVDGIYKAAFDCPAANGEVINLGGAEELTIEVLAQKIAALTESPAKLEYDHPWLDNTPRRVPSLDKAQKILGFKPTTSFEQGLAATVDWARQNYNVVA